MPMPNQPTKEELKTRPSAIYKFSGILGRTNVKDRNLGEFFQPIYNQYTPSGYIVSKIQIGTHLSGKPIYEVILSNSLAKWKVKYV